MTDSVYWIWFQLVFGIGTPRAGELQAYFRSPREIFDGVAANNRVAGMLSKDELAACTPAMEEAVQIQRRTRRKGCEIVTPDHPAYPPLLKEISYPPAALYVKGELSCIGDTLAIAMVGARRHTPYGAQVSQALAGGLVAAGAVVVSGLAVGIDTACHNAALAAGGKTIGVLGCGIDMDYPLGSRELKTAISRSGAVITEYPLGTKPSLPNFPMRNRIISGMCRGTVVVEAKLRSGSLVTARLAKEQGRDLFAVPGPIFQEEAQGAHKLLREGAILVESAADILGRYPELASSADSMSATPAKPAAVKKTIPREMGEAAAKVYGQFALDTITVDDIVAVTDLGTGEILTALTELELYGLIQSHPGRRFGLT